MKEERGNAAEPALKKDFHWKKYCCPWTFLDPEALVIDCATGASKAGLSSQAPPLPSKQQTGGESKDL